MKRSTKEEAEAALRLAVKDAEALRGPLPDLGLKAGPVRASLGELSAAKRPGRRSRKKNR